MKICICSSMAFYEKFTILKNELESLGHSVITPELEVKTKSEAIKTHFKNINNSDCILITNY